MQAIQTRYFGPTNRRGSRVVATAYGGRVSLGWESALDSDENHQRAAHVLAQKLGWLECNTLVSGTLKDGSEVHVLVPRD